MCGDVSVAYTHTILRLQARDVAQGAIAASIVPPQELASRGRGHKDTTSVPGCFWCDGLSAIFSIHDVHDKSRAWLDGIM